MKKKLHKVDVPLPGPVTGKELFVHDANGDMRYVGKSLQDIARMMCHPTHGVPAQFPDGRYRVEGKNEIYWVEKLDGQLYLQNTVER